MRQYRSVFSRQINIRDRPGCFPYPTTHWIYITCVYMLIQGGDVEAGSVLCWHPTLQVLAVATNAAVVEYDALSGCRRNMVDCDGSPVKLRYTANGEYLILLTRVCGNRRIVVSRV